MQRLQTWPCSQAFVSRMEVAYGMRRGKCRGVRPDLDGDVRSEGLTGSIAGGFWKTVTGSELYSMQRDRTPESAAR